MEACRTFAKNLKGEMITFNVEASPSFEFGKATSHDKDGITPDQYRNFFAGKQLVVFGCEKFDACSDVGE
eukprot:3569690-Karenia_brevis.AAC.1